MADFCRQCALELWGEDQEDLAHFGKGKPPLEPGYGYPCICEGCGYIRVNDLGECLEDDCLRKGHPEYKRTDATTG
jgi:hypothetical protein